MKKIFIVLSLVLSLVLCSCGGDEVSSTPAESTPVPPQESVGGDSSEQESVPDTTSQPDQSGDISLPADTDYETAQVNASGHFLSDYGCGLDIEVIWTLETTSPGKVLYTAEVYLISYSIKVGARYSDCYLTVNGEKIDFPKEESFIGKDYYGSRHPKLIEEFYKKLDTGGDMPVSLESAASVIRLILATYNSHDKKIKI